MACKELADLLGGTVSSDDLHEQAYLKGTGCAARQFGRKCEGVCSVSRTSQACLDCLQSPALCGTSGPNGETVACCPDVEAALRCSDCINERGEPGPCLSPGLAPWLVAIIVLVPLLLIVLGWWLWRVRSRARSDGAASKSVDVDPGVA